jgi:hypothetical protein
VEDLTGGGTWLSPEQRCVMVDSGSGSFMGRGHPPLDLLMEREKQLHELSSVSYRGEKIEGLGGLPSARKWPVRGVAVDTRST